MPTRIANAAIPARSRRNGHGNGFAKRCAHGERATALRRPPTTGRARTHAGAAARRLDDYRPENGPLHLLSPICTEPGRRPAPTPSAAPEPWASMLLIHGPRSRLVICERASKIAANATAIRLCSSSNAGVGVRVLLARGATASCACKPPRIGPPASTSTTLATRESRAEGRSFTTSGSSTTSLVARLARSRVGAPGPVVLAFVLARVRGSRLRHGSVDRLSTLRLA